MDTGRGSRERDRGDPCAAQPVLLPPDGVYGLCASAFNEAPVRRLYELKGRDAGAAVGDDRRERRRCSSSASRSCAAAPP